jgi:plasmid replication initiation protein
MRGLDEPRNIFQLLNWDIFNHFSGKYEAVIYKLCRDYVGVRRTPYLTLEEFRKYMGLQPTEYTEFMRLGQRVIYGPCKAINESQDCDISVEPKIERKGRQAIGISFLVEPRDKTLLPFIDAENPPILRFRPPKPPSCPSSKKNI